MKQGDPFLIKLKDGTIISMNSIAKIECTTLFKAPSIRYTFSTGGQFADTHVVKYDSGEERDEAFNQIFELTRMTV